MLTIFGKPSRNRFCDGMRRRDFLKIGGMVMGGLSLPQFLAAESRRRRSFAQGGYQHFPARRSAASGHVGPEDGRAGRDPRRVQADQDQRAGHRDLRVVPGRGMMDKFVPIRTIVGCRGDTTPFMPHGPVERIQPAGGWPSMGAWVSKLQGPVNPTIPPHLSLFYKTGHVPWGDPGNGGFLGVAHAPFRLVGGQNETVEAREYGAQGHHARTAGRSPLAAAPRQLSPLGGRERRDGRPGCVHAQAMGILTSSALAEAWT